MKKIVILVVLIFCLLPTTEYAYSFVNNQDSIVLNSDQSLYHFYEEINNENQTLIPIGALLKENDTYYLRYSYQVYIEEGMNYDVSIEDIKSSVSGISDEDLDQLFNFQVNVDQGVTVQTSSGLLTNSQSAYLVQITILVSMNDIPQFEQYDELMNNQIDFRISLHVYE